MRFAYYDRLSPASKRIYRKSDTIDSLAVPPALQLGHDVLLLGAALRSGEPKHVSRVCQRLVDTLTAGYNVPPVRVRVLSRRPSDEYGELQGLYEPEEGATPTRITLWMRTAQREQVVAFKTFFRTLIHELCHHLDYELFAMEETFHTEGFYKRESSLSNALLTQAAAADAAPPL